MIHRSTVCLLLVLFSSAAVRADEQVRSTQEELRRRNIFFGDVDGRQSREFEEALKRYQSKKGLAATGKRDRETLRSLGLAAREQGEPLPKALEWPEEPVLKSDVKLDVIGTAEEISTSTGVSLSSLVPDRSVSGPRGRRADRRRGTAPDSSSARTSAASAAQGAGFSPGQSGKLQGELTAYLRKYLQAMGRNRLEDELHFYADRVDYLGNGPVDRRIIEQSLRKYYQRWPSRHYTQIGGINYRAIPSRAEIVATFQTQFSLSNGKARVGGVTASQVVINAATSDPRIVSITEQRIRR